MKIGQRVVDRYGQSGVVAKCFANFASMECLTMTPEEWLEQQIIPFTSEQLEEPWISVSMDDGGSVWSPRSLLEIGAKP